MELILGSGGNTGKPFTVIACSICYEEPSNELLANIPFSLVRLSLTLDSAIYILLNLFHPRIYTPILLVLPGFPFLSCQNRLLSLLSLLTSLLFFGLHSINFSFFSPVSFPPSPRFFAFQNDTLSVPLFQYFLFTSPQYFIHLYSPHPFPFPPFPITFFPSSHFTCYPNLSLYSASFLFFTIWLYVLYRITKGLVQQQPNAI